MSNIYPDPIRSFKSYNGGKRKHVKTTQDFIDKASFVWGDHFDYTNTVFVSRDLPIVIMCKHHQFSFWIIPRTHIESSLGGGCPQCRHDKVVRDRQHSIEQWVNKFRRLHGDDYSYDLFTDAPKNAGAKIHVICNSCDLCFDVSIRNHVYGRGCPSCRYAKSSKALIWSKEKFVCEAKKVHGDRYDYANSVYTGYSNPVTIRCTTHGNFTCSVSNHLGNESGCPVCAKERSTHNSLTYNGNIFLYVIKMYDEFECFYKIGITSKSVRQRFRTIVNRGGYDVEEVAIYEDDYRIIVSLENELHRSHAHASYEPYRRFYGHTECFSDVDLDSIRPILENIKARSILV